MYHYMSNGQATPIQAEDENLPLLIKNLVNQVNYVAMLLCIVMLYEGLSLWLALCLIGWCWTWAMYIV